jgi:hypothetical protein
LALNIVHAVEFSRNGRTRFDARRGHLFRGGFVFPSGHPEGRIRMLQADRRGISSTLGIVPLEADERFCSFAPLGQRVITLRGSRGPCKFWLHPGRVASHGRFLRTATGRRTTTKGPDPLLKESKWGPCRGACRHSTKMPARVFLPRRSTAMPPRGTRPSSVAVSSSTRTLSSDTPPWAMARRPSL